MKKKEILTLIGIIIVSAIFSFTLSNLLIGGNEARNERVEVVSDISDDFMRPDSRFFNENAVNPTQTIEISEEENTTPFSDSQ